MNSNGGVDSLNVTISGDTGENQVSRILGGLRFNITKPLGTEEIACVNIVGSPAHLQLVT